VRLKSFQARSTVAGRSGNRMRSVQGMQESRLTVIGELRGLLEYRELVRNLVVRDLKIKYKGSVLGFLWSLINTLIMLMVYWFVFTVVFHVDMENFPVYFILGYLPWNFFVISLMTACGSIVDNAGLIKKVYFPRLIIPLAIVLSSFVQFLLTFVVLLPALWYFDIRPTYSLIALPGVMILHILFTSGFCFLVSTIYVYFRDTKHFLEILVTIWFWATPIVYPISKVTDSNAPQALKNLLLYNPMTQFINAYRDVLFDPSFPSLRRWLALSAVTLVTLVIGFYVFHRQQPKFAETL
jgi:lipopolysaccharide transport system permease protein